MVNAGVPLGCNLYGLTSRNPVGAVPVGFVSRLNALSGYPESIPHRRRALYQERAQTKDKDLLVYHWD